MKKSILFLLILISFSGIAQNQISELAKGMVAHFPLSEWYPDVDLVSGVQGTATDVYNVIGRGGDGRRWYEFDGVNDYVTLPTIPAFGTGDFSTTTVINIKELKNWNCIIGGADNTFGLMINSSGQITSWKVGVANIGTSTGTISIGTEFKVGYSRSGTTGTFYINGVASGTCTDNYNYTVANTLLGEYKTGSENWFSGSISLVRIFNYALTPTQIANYSKPEYPIEASDRDGAGNLCVLDLNADGMGTNWVDKTNSLTATVSGATLQIPPASEMKSTYFNGSTSKIELTGMNGLAGITTISARIRPLALGGYLLTNTKVKLYVNSSGYLTFSRDGTTYINSGAGSIAINTDYNILITSTAAGVTNFYINNVLSGTANQAAGTPASGTSWTIGSNATLFYNGLIGDLRINGEILDLDRIKLLNDIN